MASKLGNITFDCADPKALSSFWAEVFGYPQPELPEELKTALLEGGLTEADLADRSVAEDPSGQGPRFFFQKVPEAKIVKNRMHIDIAAVPGRRPTTAEVDAEKDRIVSLGASVIRLYNTPWGQFPEYHYIMQDPEGNEFCLQ